MGFFRFFFQKLWINGKNCGQLAFCIGKIQLFRRKLRRRNSAGRPKAPKNTFFKKLLTSPYFFISKMPKKAFLLIF